MEHVLNNPTIPQNPEMIHAAVGKNAQVDEIKKTVQTLKTGTIPVQLSTHSDPQSVALVEYDTGDNPAKYPHFGKSFHDGKGTANMRAATLVDEATHKFLNTGDLVDLKTNKMILDDDFSKDSPCTGYASNIEPATTAKQLNADKNRANMRDGTGKHPAVVDLHNNAEFYALVNSSPCVMRQFRTQQSVYAVVLWKKEIGTLLVYISSDARHARCARREQSSQWLPRTLNTPAANAKFSAVSKLAAKKPIAAAAGKRTIDCAKATALKAGSAQPLLKTIKGVPINKLGQSRFPSAKTVAPNKTPISGTRRTALKTGLVRKAPVKSTASKKKDVGKKPATSKMNVTASKKNIVGKKPTTNKTGTLTKSTASKKNVVGKESTSKTNTFDKSSKKPAIRTPNNSSQKIVANKRVASAKPKSRQDEPSTKLAPKAPTKKAAAASRKSVPAKHMTTKTVVRKSVAVKPAASKPTAVKGCLPKPVVAPKPKVVAKPAVRAPVKKTRRHLDFQL